jgi:DNA-binding YbaB/EbfC family protein
MKGPLAQLMQQAQKMQENMKRVQDEIAALEITGESGGGMVKVTINGRHEARRVQIAQDALGEDKEFLEDLVAAAINDAAQKLEAASKERMSKVAGGMNLPPGMNLGNLGL